MYDGYFFLLMLPVPATVKGVALQFCNQPVAGLIRWTVSDTG
jgi:hypothetical protein